MPTALSEGEIGYAVDSGQVFIGAPNLAALQYRLPGNSTVDGVFPYANTRLLTEFDVAYNIAGDVYYHGPLQNYSIPLNSGTLNNTYTGTSNITGTYTFTNFFNITTTDLFIIKLTANGTVMPSNSYSISGQNLVIDEGNVGFALPDGTVFSAYYAYNTTLLSIDPTVYNTIVYDYSLISNNGTTTLAGQPMRTGTMWIITDGVNASLRDEYVELNTVFEGQTGVTFSASIQTGQLVLSAANISAYNQKVWLSGRQWYSTT